MRARLSSCNVLVRVWTGMRLKHSQSWRASNLVCFNSMQMHSAGPAPEHFRMAAESCSVSALSQGLESRDGCSPLSLLSCLWRFPKAVEGTGECLLSVSPTPTLPLPIGETGQGTEHCGMLEDHWNMQPFLEACQKKPFQSLARVIFEALLLSQKSAPSLFEAVQIAHLFMALLCLP